jgi:hypothetical protein
MTALIINLAQARAARAKRSADPFAMWMDAWEFWLAFWRI